MSSSLKNKHILPVFGAVASAGLIGASVLMSTNIETVDVDAVDIFVAQKLQDTATNDILHQSPYRVDITGRDRSNIVHVEKIITHYDRSASEGNLYPSELCASFTAVKFANFDDFLGIDSKEIGRSVCVPAAEVAAFQPDPL